MKWKVKIPRAVFEHLTINRLEQAKTVGHVDNFHEDKRIPLQYRATLADYKGSGYDRGHMAPSTDMADQEQQYQSFALSNIIPQDPVHNRGIWRDIETMARRLTYAYGEIFVVTSFSDVQKETDTGLFVPSQLIKTIYIPKTGHYFRIRSNNDDKGGECLDLQARASDQYDLEGERAYEHFGSDEYGYYLMGENGELEHHVQKSLHTYIDVGYDALNEHGRDYIPIAEHHKNMPFPPLDFNRFLPSCKNGRVVGRDTVYFDQMQEQVAIQVQSQTEEDKQGIFKSLWHTIIGWFT